MVYVNKDTFDICTSESKYYFTETDDLLEVPVDEMAFECDDLIAPTIAMLNSKGYETEYCCQGHYQISEYKYRKLDDGTNSVYINTEPGIESYPYISFKKMYPIFKTNAPEGWELRYSPVHMEDIIKRNKAGRKFDDDKKIRGVECKNTLRLGIVCDKFINRIKNRYGSDQNMMYLKYNDWISKEMIKLYEWAKNLPNV